jgi:hypothetical protein
MTEVNYVPLQPANVATVESIDLGKSNESQTPNQTRPSDALDGISYPEPLLTETISLLVGEGEASADGSSSALTPDQQHALDLCGDDQACRENLLELFDIINDSPAPPWWNIETITFGGRCVWWTTHTRSDIIDAQQQGTDLGGIGITENWRHYIGPNPLWTEHHYWTVTLPNGNRFYLDVYWLGGGDHILFELPNTLVDDAGYADYWERRAQELELVLQVIP